MPGGMEFDFTMRGAGAGAPRETQPFSLLLLGHYGVAGADDAATAPVMKVDIDNLDSLWDRFEPRLELDVDGVTMVFEPRDLDDFHPDALFAALPAFRELRELRKRLLDPSSADEALAEVLRSAAPVPESDASVPEDTGTSPPEGESGEDMFSRLLGDRAAGGAGDAPAPRPAPGLDALIRSAVAPHIVEESDPRADAAVNSVDQGLATLMRRILQDDAFRELEGRWRALYRLVQSAETDETLELRVGNISHRALVGGLPTSAGGLEDCGLYGLLVARHRIAADDRTPSVVALDRAFGTGPDDVALLGTLGTLAEAMDACILGEARPELLGAANTAALGDHRDWAAPGELDPLWSTLRNAPFARRIGLMLPRLLARLPYGADTDPVGAFDFEEMPVHDPAGFVWQGPVPAACELLLEAFAQQGWSLDFGGALDVGELPAFSYREDGEMHMQPCTEQLMPEAAAEAALERGIMPLAGFRNQDRARLVRVQSIASPLAALRGPWSD